MNWEEEINELQEKLKTAKAKKEGVKEENYSITWEITDYISIGGFTWPMKTKGSAPNPEAYKAAVKSFNQKVDEEEALLNAKKGEAQKVINNLVNEIAAIDSDLSAISNIIHCDKNYDQNTKLDDQHIGIKCDAHISKKNLATDKLNAVIANLTNIQRSKLFIEFSKDQLKEGLLTKVLASGDLDLPHIVNYAIDNNNEEFLNVAVSKGFDFANNKTSKKELLHFLIEKKSLFLKDFLENLDDFSFILLIIQELTGKRDRARGT